MMKALCDQRGVPRPKPETAQRLFNTLAAAGVLADDT
jgi:hypothetical protein